MKCPYCNEEIDDNSKECPVCGEKISLKKKELPKNIKIIIISGLIIMVIAVLSAVIIGLEVNSYKSVIPIHEDIDLYENTMTSREALNKMVEQEKRFVSYANKWHTDSNKEKVFFRFIDNLEYYSKVFSYQNEHKYYGESVTCILAGNKNLNLGEKTVIDEMEITPVYGESTPPNSNSNFSYLKISKPDAPFLKLIFNPYYCTSRDDLPDNIGFITKCDGPDYIVAEPDYKFIKTTYSKYLGEPWVKYFDIKIKQQEDLRNSAFANGNGGMFPIYIFERETDDWAVSMAELLEKYPDFIMYDNISKQITDINYPNYESIIKKVPVNTKLYETLKQAQKSLEEEYE